MTDNELIGKRIQELREEQKIKQELLAEKLEIKRTNLSNYETGRRTIPFDILKNIAKELKTSTDYLLGVTQSKSKSIKEQVICNDTGLSEKSVQILKEVKNLDIIKTINCLIEQEEMYLYNGFLPSVSKNCTEEKYEKAFEKAQRSYEQELKRVENSCIPILSNIHSYLKAEITKEDMYIINGTLKRLNDFGYKVNRHLADETINTNEIIENTFLEKVKIQLRDIKKRKGEKKKQK